MVVDSENINISVGSTDVGIGSVDSPSQACRGDSINLRAPIENQGDCSASARLVLVNELSGQSSVVDQFIISGGSTVTKTASSTIPLNAVEQGSIEYTFVLQLSTSDGFEEQDTETVTVDVGAATGNISNVSGPTSRCAGTEANIVVKYGNSGSCPGRFRLRVQQGENINTEEELVIESQSEETISFARPIERSAGEEETFNIILEKEFGDSWQEEASQEISVDVLVGQVSFDSIKSPQSSCIGRVFSPQIDISAQNRCSSQYRVRVDGPLNEDTNVVTTGEIDNNNTVTESYDESIDPRLADQSSVQYGVILERRFTDGGDWSQVDQSSYNVSVLTPDLQIDNISHPTEQCVGSQFSPSVSFSNDGQCSTEYRISVENGVTGESSIVSNGQISSGDQMTDRYDETITAESADSESIRYSVTVERKLSEVTDWEPVETQSFSVNVLLPNAAIQENPYPEFAKPGDKSTDIVITNDSTCSTEVTVSINGTELDTKTLSADSTATFTDEYTLLSDQVEKEVNVFDEVVGESVDNVNTTITPNRFINLDQSEGIVEIVGGFSNEIPYTGNIIATAISSGDNLEDKDTVVGALGAKSIQGTMLPGRANKDTISFGSLKGLNIQTVEPVTIVTDGQVQGESRAYQHSTITSSIVGLEGEENVDIKSVSGPLSNIGSLRRRLGVNPRVASGPIFTLRRQ